jgi:hypothetical protein
MSVITDDLDRLAERGPHADARLVVARAVDQASGLGVIEEARPPRQGHRWMVAATAVVVAAGVAAVAAAPFGSDQAAAPGASDVDPSASALPTTTLLPPVETLPELDDVAEVPVTVAGTRPTEWYRLQPDLDVAWHSHSGRSMVCFRTPVVDAECRTDDLGPATLGGLPAVIATAGGQVLVVALDSVDRVVLPLADGSDLAAPVQTDRQLGWGVARFELGGRQVAAGFGLTFGVATADEIAVGTAPATTG